MRLVDAEVGPQGHHEAGPEERQVEALPVVRPARSERGELVAERADELALAREVAQQVLTQDELAVGEVARPEEEDVRAGPAHQAGGLGVEEDDVLPPRRRLALQSEVDDDLRIGVALPDHAQPQLRELDPALEDLVAPPEAGRRPGRGRGWVGAPAGEGERIEPRPQISHVSSRSSSDTPSFTRAPRA